MRDNRFATFEPGPISAISLLSQEKGYGWLTLYIEHNVFSCSCDSIHFMNWIVENKTKIDDLNSISCKYRDTFRTLSKLYEVVYHMKLSCYYLIPVTISGAILILMISSIMIGAIAYKYRWDIHYYLITHSQKKETIPT